MYCRNRRAKINVKVLVIIVLVTVALGVSLVAARQIRRSILSKMDLKAGQAAFEKQDWQEAVKNYREYLGRRPDDVEILKRYAKALLGIRPLEAPNINGAISAYRRVIQLAPLDEVAYEQLAKLYTAIGNFEDLAYIARTRLERVPNDLKAPLWLADALVQLNKTPEAQQALEKFIGQLEALPDKHAEYVRACAGMSQIVVAGDSSEAKTKALEWLNKAVSYAPESAEAMANRARFYRERPDLSGLRVQDRLALARTDLEAADKLGTDDPRIRFFLGAEWMAHNEIERASAELEAIDSLPQEAIAEHFLDLNDWKVARFLLASELAIRRGATAEGASLADEALAVLTEKRHRVQVLPSAVQLYVVANKVPDARRCLDEYVESRNAQQGAAGSPVRLAYLQALVARAEDKPYAVIDALQPLVLTETARPDLWRLLAEAYSRTDQTRRAVSAIAQYLRFYPKDPGMTLQLAKGYARAGDWSKAFETAQLAESLNPADATIKLLRIETGISLAAEQGQGIDAARFEALSSELAQLRQQFPDRVDIRISQAIVAMHLQRPDKAESELKLAIEECNEPIRAEMQLAGHYARTKRIADAVSVCQSACKRHPDAVEPWLSLADLYVANADYNSARECLKQGLNAVTGKAANRSFSIQSALLELMHGDRSLGIRLLTDLAAQDGQEIYARLLLLGIPEIRKDQARAERLVAELRQAEGQGGLQWRLHQASLWLSSDAWRSRQQDTTDLLQYCIDADPQWSAPVLLLAGMHERLGDSRRAEDICRQSLARNTSAVDVADRLLAFLERQGRFSEAEKVLQQIQAAPRVSSVWQIRLALGAGDLSKAIAELRLRVSSDDRDANSRIQLARLVYQQSKDVDQAFRYLKEAEAITPGSMTLTAGKVLILRAEGRTEEARQILNEYVANRNDFTAYWMRAVYRAEAGELDGAEEDYRKLTTFADNGIAGYELLGNFYVSSQKVDKAVAAIDEGMKAYPEDLRLKRDLMKLLLLRAQSQDRDRAMEILTALEGRLPQDPELMAIRAMQMLAGPTPQSRGSARAKLENVIKLDPTAVNAHLMLIGMAMQDGDFQAARDYGIQAIGYNPNNPALLSARGRAELALDNTQMAVELAHLVLQRDPNNAEALDVLVQAAIRSQDRGLLGEARTRIESAVRANATNEGLLLARSRVLASLDMPKAAIPELEAYCQTQGGSRSIAAFVTLADLYRLSGDMDKARQKIEQAEQVDPNSLAVIHSRFLWLVAQRRFEELGEISSAYLSAKQQDPRMLMAAAATLAASDSTKLKKEGLKLFEHVATLSPTSVDARQGLASCLYQTGNVERAKKVYQELLKQYPNDIRILNDFAWIIQEQDHQYDAALEMANKGLSLSPKDLHLLDTRGTILLNMPNRLADARTDFERLVELSPADSPRLAKALLQLGRVCARLNDLVGARQYMKKALELDQKVNVFTPDERSEIKNDGVTSSFVN